MERDIQPEGKTIAEHLRTARLVAKMTQQELAGERFSKSYISAVERGKMTPSIQGLEYLADHLRVPISYFLGETEFTLSTLAGRSTQSGPSSVDQEQARKEEAAQLLLAEAEQAEAATAVALLRAAAYLSPRVRPRACAHLARLSLAQGALEEAEALIEEGRAAARASADVPAEGRSCWCWPSSKSSRGTAQEPSRRIARRWRCSKATPSKTRRASAIASGWQPLAGTKKRSTCSRPTQDRASHRDLVPRPLARAVRH